MFRYIKKVDNPQVLLITPLRKKDTITEETLNGMKKNKVKYDWISYASKYNPVVNCSKALRQYNREIPPYLMKLDRDVIPDKGWLDAMYDTLKESESNVAYAYTTHHFSGRLRASFPVREFDPEALKKGNYISFNSLIKSRCLFDIGGFVDLEGQDRLWDWALWLTFLKYGYIGAPVHGKEFTIFASKNDISLQGQENYRKNYRLVREKVL